MSIKKVKITNTSDSVIVVLDRNLSVDEYDYFVYADVVRDTTAYDMEGQGLVSIEDVDPPCLDSDGSINLDEIQGNLSISHDSNGFVNFISSYWDPDTMLKPRYTMTSENTRNGAILKKTEEFFDTNGVLMLERTYEYLYDSQGRFIGRTLL